MAKRLTLEHLEMLADHYGFDRPPSVKDFFANPSAFMCIGGAMEELTDHGLTWQKMEVIKEKHKSLALKEMFDAAGGKNFFLKLVGEITQEKTEDELIDIARNIDDGSGVSLEDFKTSIDEECSRELLPIAKAMSDRKLQGILRNVGFKYSRSKKRYEKDYSRCSVCGQQH